MTDNGTHEQESLVSREVGDFSHRVKAMDKLKKSQVFFPAQPWIPDELRDSEGDFQMPTDLTNMQSHQLGQLMGVINGMLQFYGSVVATTKVDRLTAERVKNFKEASVRMEILNDEQKKKDFKAREDKDAYINANPDVQQAQDWYDAQESLVLMSEQIYRDYERAFNLISREISRRGSNFNRDEREGNLR